MAKVITVAQQKGGAGKTSLLLHLAVVWASGRRRVAVIDTDPQHSLSAWFARRRARIGDQPRLVHRAAEGWKTASEIDRVRRAADVVLVDTPPHAETATRTAIRPADLVIVPMQPTPMDLWATRQTLAMAADERVPALLVLNRVPPRSRMADDIRADLAEGDVPVTRAALGNRQLFASSLTAGHGVTEAARRSRAAEEISALADELWKRLKAL